MIMARLNAEAEAEAIDLLAPPPDAQVLVIGFGAGVGVAKLAERLASGMILGVDPSAAMMRAACRRNRKANAEGRVRLVLTTAESIPAPDAWLDGALAVNALQLCEPIEATAKELARVLKPGARVVSLTHDWAAARRAGSAEAWAEGVMAALGQAGFGQTRTWRARAETGRAIGLEATRE
jgi:ubiquinone/menaquinone biosynthesis C-methylase UbiE